MVPPEKLSFAIVDVCVADVSVKVSELRANPPVP
jgi:hypothetical protein